jgi:hypothetical protein
MTSEFSVAADLLSNTVPAGILFLNGAASPRRPPHNPSADLNKLEHALFNQ